MTNKTEREQIALSALEQIRFGLQKLVDQQEVNVCVEEAVITTGVAEKHPVDEIDTVQTLIDFIEAKLLYRNKYRTKERVDSLSAEELLYDFDIINCSGLRGYGHTSAIVEMFNPKLDVYVGRSMDAIKEFKLKLADWNYGNESFEWNKIFYVNFNTVKHSNMLISESIDNKLKDYFKSVQLLKYNSSEGSFKVDNVNTIYEMIGVDKSMCGTTQLRGRTIHTQAKVFIDLDMVTQMKFSVRLLRLISEMCLINSKKGNDVVFIIV